MKLDHFNYLHLPAHLQQFSKPFHDLAHELHKQLPQSAELNAGLRKLMEAKDCIVRAAIEQHGVRAPQPDQRPRPGSIDPLSGEPLPANSPYSMAHVPVTPGYQAPGEVPPHDPSNIVGRHRNAHSQKMTYTYRNGDVVRHTEWCDFNHTAREQNCCCGAAGTGDVAQTTENPEK